MLKIDNLQAGLEDGSKQILQGLNLEIKPGEVHAIMGPNGSGKSTLSYILSGKDGYDVNGGSATFLDQDLLDLEPEERAALGLFLAFQYPVEIPGVPTTTFLKEAMNQMREARGEKPLDAFKFLKLIREKCKELNMSEDFMKRAVNVGFSGGEKKRAETLQMSVLEPKLAILDETDSGLDIDALKIVADGVNRLRSPERSFLVITHYQRLLDYIVPDVVHVMSAGKIVKSGGKELALELEANGYKDYEVAA